MYEYQHAIYSNISTSLSLLVLFIQFKNKQFLCVRLMQIFLNFNCIWKLYFFVLQATAFSADGESGQFNSNSSEHVLAQFYLCHSCTSAAKYSCQLSLCEKHMIVYYCPI